MNTHFNLRYLAILSFLCCSSCVGIKDNKTDGNNNKVINDSVNTCNDTIININSTYSLILSQCNENDRVRYSNPAIQSNKIKRDIDLFLNTSKIELDFHISENQKFLVMCYIAENGSVYKTESDSIYHEIFRCSMIELNTGKVIIDELSPEESTGVWNSQNKWIETSTGKVLITPQKKN